jgi:inhibitor of KinA sporulation pathway (predicted exonuclease)
MSPTEMYPSKTQFIDVEMLCWNKGEMPADQTNHIIQIGIVEVDNISLNINRKENFFVRPADKNFEVSDYCTALTGITREQIVTKGTYFPESMNRIQKHFSSRQRVTYAWGKDQQVIQAHCDTYQIQNPWGQTGIWDFSIYFRSAFNIRRSIRLSQALKNLNIDFPGAAHDALNDATALAELYIEMMRKLRNA